MDKTVIGSACCISVAEKYHNINTVSSNGI